MDDNRKFINFKKLASKPNSYMDIVLSNKDFLKFIEACEEPKKPTNSLTKAFEDSKKKGFD